MNSDACAPEGTTEFADGRKTESGIEIVGESEPSTTEDQPEPPPYFLEMVNHPDNELGGKNFPAYAIESALDLGWQTSNLPKDLTPAQVAETIWYSHVESPRKILRSYVGIIAGNPYQLKKLEDGFPRVIIPFPDFKPTTAELNEQLAVTIGRNLNPTELGRLFDLPEFRAVVGEKTTPQDLREVAWKYAGHQGKRLVWLSGQVHNRDVRLLVIGDANPDGTYLPLSAEPPTTFWLWRWIGNGFHRLSRLMARH